MLAQLSMKAVGISYESCRDSDITRFVPPSVLLQIVFFTLQIFV